IEVEVSRDDTARVARQAEVEWLGTRGNTEEHPLTIEQSVILERADGHRGLPVLAVLVPARKRRAEPRDLVWQLASHDPTEVVVLEVLDVADLVVAEPGHRARTVPDAFSGSPLRGRGGRRCWRRSSPPGTPQGRRGPGVPPRSCAGRDRPRSPAAGRRSRTRGDAR